MIGDTGDAGLQRIVEAVEGPDVRAALRLAAQLTDLAPRPGGGSTGQRWGLLAAIAARDLTTARVVEAHLDAVAILAEAAADPDVDPAALEQIGASPLHETTWGVFAAEGPGARLSASGADDRGWVLNGVKPWCSLAGSLSHALVTANVGDQRRLFAIRLRDNGVQVDSGAWHARGLADVPSGPVAMRDVAAVPVGESGWYLRRAGFAHGGAGVAACWYGAAVALGRSLMASAQRREPDQLAQWHLGRVDLALQAAGAALRRAAGDVDRGEASGAAGERLALRVRSIVAAAAEEVLERVGHALGPAPLALDPVHARRVADLTVYLRQHHGERDVAALGRALVAGGDPAW